MSATAFTLCLVLAGTGRTWAAADPSDHESVSEGAQLYELYCSDCHGIDSTERTSEIFDDGEMDISDDYSPLIEIVRNVGTPQQATAPEDDWPEWAERPNPNASRKPDFETEVSGAVTGVIGRVHGTGFYPDAEEGEDAGDIEDFDPLPGATNLADPATYFYGTSEEDLFNSIANGAGTAMPGWRDELGSDEAVWDLVSYIRSLWAEEWLY